MAFITTGTARSQEQANLDCGMNSLYVLLNLTNHRVNLDDVKAVLPSRDPRGFSMAELATAAAALGLELEGIPFNWLDGPLASPAIVFLEDKRGGHFAVLRPVGTTGTMVQVIDPPNVPWITDYAHLHQAKIWTGRVLIPRGTSSLARATFLVLLATIVALLTSRILARRGAARSTC